MSRSFGGTSVTSRSPIRMRPASISSRPASMRSEVDLPQPEGPTRTRNSPSPISMSRLSTAARSCPGEMRDALSNVTVAMVCSLHRQVRAGRSVVKCRSPVSCALAGEVRPCTGSRSVAQLSPGSGLGPRVCPRAPGERLTRDTRGVDIAELTRKILDRRDGPSRPLRIVQAGHPALRHTSRSARGRLDEDLLRELVEAMTVTMRGARGVGLAAPQVGLPLAVFVMEDRSADPGAGARCPDMEPEAEKDVGDVTAALERTPVPLRAILDPTVEPLGTQRVYA